jgi:pimeloyl-ACP methyl ester carboxylesterase
MPTKYARIDGLAIHYVHEGTTTLPDVPPPLGRGRPLLLIHGEGGSASLWARQMAHFARAHSPVALDLPAHGRSCGLDALDSVAAAAALVGRFLAALEAPPAVIVGHGLGGQVALELALARPERVHGVVTIGTAARAEVASGQIEQLRKVVQGKLGQQFDTPFFGAQPDFAVMRQFWGEMVKTDPRSRLADLLVYQASDFRGRLAGLNKPVLVIHGEADRICPRAKADELRGAVAGAELVSIAGAGHVPFLEKPDEVNQAIDTFLARVSKA